MRLKFYFWEKPVIGWSHRLSWIYRLNILGVILVFATTSLPAWSGSAQDNIIRGEKIYNKSCISCHGNPKSGAPQLTEKKAWENRINQPRKRLMQHVLKGFKKMPARGGDSSLNVHNVGDALDYMLFTILGLEDLINNPKNNSAKNSATAPPIAEQNPQAAESTVANQASNLTQAPSLPAPATESAEESESNLLANANPLATNRITATPGTKISSSEFTRQFTSDLYSPHVDTFLAQVNSKKILSEEDLAIPQDKYGDDVRLGYRIFTNTAQYASRYTGNDLSCSNCHLDGGRRAYAAPMWGAIGMYPAYKQRNDRNNTLEDRIQQCFQFSLNGFAPSPDSPEIRALLSYIHFISRGVPIGVNMPGRGFVSLENTGYDPNPARGLSNYEKYCVSCHQADGSGKRNENAKGFAIPPLWGRHAYNKAAGFSHIGKLAGFIKSNMPINQATLSTQEALDIAAYINQQIRPGDPRKGLFDAWFGE